ncbi:hypothetical protein CANARDRAFT_6491 [[Candida] arabinofermentans NRRL YB-2248]|uniref:2-dehydropantoate 2-reductase n=1 Tax=[Candida] arabinofermentans NRRL YB-2248 TaxID=983967 RepID=A0A1E4T595_9ASCO|nr:hypothetical protein CANARDRAFT_6491 [[Candida] arabinofermentans NRRL YB-2248]
MSSPKAKVLLVGMGGVGSVAAYSLEYGGKAEVTAVLRSDYQTLIDDGFEFESVDHGKVNCFRPTNITKSVEEAMEKYGPFDYAIFSLKNIPDISPIEPLIAKCYTPEVGILLLQNGIGIEKPIFKLFPEAYVMSGVTMVSSTLYGRKVVHVATEHVRVGAYDNGKIPYEKQVAKCKKFIEIYSTDKNDIIYDENVNFSRWRKLVYNACVNSSAALTDCDIGRLEVFGAMDPIVRPAMREILAIAKSDGVDLPEDVIEFMIRSDDGEWYPPSMLVDMRKGNYCEYQVILGNALDIAKENGVPAPVLSCMYHLLHVVQMKTQEKKGKFVLPEVRPLPADNFQIKYLN